MIEKSPIERVYAGLTLGDSEVASLSWSGPVVFRRCVFRDVSFKQASFSGLCFEDVLFERCQFDGLQLDACTFLRCRFAGGSLGEWRAETSRWTECVFTDLTAGAWDLAGCTLDACVLRDCAVVGLRAAGCELGALTIEGGELLAASWTLCTGKTIRVRGATVKRLAVLDGTFEGFALEGTSGSSVILNGPKIGVVAIEGGSGLATVHFVRAAVEAMRIDACPSLQALFVYGSRIGCLEVRGSTLYDTAFEDVEAPGESRFDDCSLAGLFFRRGSWADLRLRGLALEDYLAVEGAHFAALDRRGAHDGDGLRYRLDGDTYGEGSMTWRQTRAA